MTLEEQLQAEREARIRAEAMLEGYRQAMVEALAAIAPARDTAAERRRAYDRSRKARVSTGIPPESTGTATSPSSPFPSSFPPSPEPSSPYPLSFPPSSPPPSASQEPASAAPDFELTSPSSSKPSRRQRTPSGAESLFSALQATRKQRCEEVGEPWIPESWPEARQNKALGPIARADAAAKALFEAAWGLYLADDGERVREPAWSLSWFMSGGVRARYETRAVREGA